MSIKFLCDRNLEFSRKDLGAKDGIEKIQAKIGFNELPDWVGNDDYFALNEKDGTIKSFESSKEADRVVKEAELSAKAKRELKSLQEKIEQGKIELADIEAAKAKVAEDAAKAAEQTK